MGYPPGAEHDSSAPYNGVAIRPKYDKVKDVVTDEDCKEYDCTVEYRYRQDDVDVEIESYKVIIKAAHNIPEDILDEQVRDIIKEQFSERTEIYFQ